MQTRNVRWSMVLLSLAGCASLQGPPADLASGPPVVEIAQGAAPDGDYVLHIPAGREIPVRLVVGGSFLGREGSAETSVTLPRDLYLYKHWSSFDGRHWERSHDLFETTVSAGLEPGGGLVEVRIDTARP